MTPSLWVLSLPPSLVRNLSKYRGCPTLVLSFLVDGADYSQCCSCMLLSFTEQIENKKMVVQVTNTGSDLSRNHFDIAMPGGGVGIFNGCTKQWEAPTDGWGDRYGGVHTIEVKVYIFNV